MDISNSDDEQYDEEVPQEESVDVNQEMEDSHNNNSLKILKDIKSLGCSDKALIAATYRVYLDLCEVRKHQEVSYHYNQQLDHLYIRTRKKAEDPEEVTVPILSLRKYSFKDFEMFQDAFESEAVNIAICDSNSIAIYKLTRSR